MQAGKATTSRNADKTLGVAVSEGEESVRAFARGLSVIESMGTGPPRKSIAQIAAATNLPRSVVRRLMMTLCEQRYAQTDGKLYALTPRVLSLGLSYLHSLPFWRYAQPSLEKLRSQVQESCAMAVLHEEDIVYVLRIPARRILAMNLSIGSRLPAHLVSLGQVLIAHLDEPALRQYLSVAKLNPFTSGTITKARVFKKRLEAVRRQGYAWVDRELDPAICGIAVPVYNGAGTVVAAINVSLISGTYDEDTARRRFLVPLRQAAEQIRSATPN